MKEIIAYLENEILLSYKNIGDKFPGVVNTIYTKVEFAGHLLEIILIGSDPNDDDYGIVLDFKPEQINENTIKLRMEVLNGIGNFLYEDVLFISSDSDTVFDVKTLQKGIEKIRETCEIGWGFFFNKYLSI